VVSPPIRQNQLKTLGVGLVQMHGPVCHLPSTQHYIIVPANHARPSVDRIVFSDQYGYPLDRLLGLVAAIGGLRLICCLDRVGGSGECIQCLSVAIATGDRQVKTTLSLMAP
jgi:hypothetical protein